MQKKIKKQVAETKSRMEVHYKKLPNNILLITGFSGIFTEEQLVVHFPEKVVSAYLDHPVHMVLTGSPFDRTVTIRDKEGRQHLHTGSQINRKDLGKIIAKMIRCGKILSEINTAVTIGMTHTIPL